MHAERIEPIHIKTFHMVSTRSRSLVSNSSLLTGQGKDINAGEVTSKEAPQSTPRTTRRTRQQQPTSLEVIAEEAPIRSTRKTKQIEEPPKEPETIDDQLIDKVADNIFAALDEAFGSDNEEEETSGSDSSDAEDEDEEGLPIKESKLRWRPDLRLPGMSIGKRSGISSDELAGPSGRAGTSNDIADDLLADKSGNLSKHLHVPSSDTRELAKAAKKSAPDSAGKSWFDLPASTITDEVKNDLRVLRLRSTFDPKNFYKKFDSTKFPKYFQFGTVVEGPTEFYSSRLTRKERKRTLTEEIMADPQLTAVRKKRYTKMQDEAARVAPRSGRKTDNARMKKKPKRPKH